MFLDEAKINVKAGDGGNGLVSFFYKKGAKKRIANGGNGGKGGDVIFKSSTNVSTLQSFKKKIHFKAGNGQAGMPNNKKGKDGQDLIIQVPVGTIIKDNDGKILADLKEDDMEINIARGGIGGRGNSSFVSGKRRFPGFSEFGEKVEEAWLELELRLLADIALVGFPNAGKSTLISSISAAKPKIADYPFTTLTPNLGVVEIGYESFVVADIPGIIEDAHRGTGLRDKFLRHIMRSKVLAFILDGQLALEKGAEAVAASFDILRQELKLYHLSLYKKDYLIVLNKSDIITDKKMLNDIEGAFKKRGIDKDFMVISAATGQGIPELKQVFFKKLKDVQEVVEEEERILPDKEKTHRVYDVHSTAALQDKIEIESAGDEYTVKNLTLERLIAMTDIENEEALDYLMFRLKKSRIGDRLKQMGVPIGSTVIIGKLVFDLEE